MKLKLAGMAAINLKLKAVKAVVYQEDKTAAFPTPHFFLTWLSICKCPAPAKSVSVL